MAKRPLRWFIVLGVLAGLVGGALLLRDVFTPGGLAGTAPRGARVWQWLRNPEEHPEWAMKAGQNCNEAPFQMPTDGFIGFLWGDSFRPGHQHQGLDIFGGKEAGLTPVYAAYDGYLTREGGWISTVIIRIPSDPLNPGRQIWTYYTHMASDDGQESYIAAAFPPGTSEMFVEAGTLLGYQGDYSGDPNNPVGVHLHFSIVRDNGSGGYRNELNIENTIDPSPYLGLAVNAYENPDEVPVCEPPDNTG